MTMLMHTSAFLRGYVKEIAMKKMQNEDGTIKREHSTAVNISWNEIKANEVAKSARNKGKDKYQ